MVMTPPVFAVNVNEIEHLSEAEQARVGSLKLSSVDVKGLKPTLEKHANEENVESKGVKAHFALDDSGILNITHVESVFERTISVEQQEKEIAEKEAEKKAKEGEGQKADGEKGKDDDSNWANLGDTISNFFNKENEEKEKKQEKQEEKAKSEEKPKEKPKKELKPKVETIKENLEFKVKILDSNLLTDELRSKSKQVLKALNEHDELKKKKESALNNLESFVIDVRDKLYQDVWEESATEMEKEQFGAKCSEISDWIDEEVTPDTELEPLETKLKELKELTSPWFARVKEHLDRPEALSGLDQMLNTSTHFLAKAKNKTGEDGFFTMTELETLEKKLQDVQKWRDDEFEAQNLQPKSEMPKMTTGKIAEKALDLDREVKYLLNKAKIAKAEQDKKKAKEKAEADEKAKQEKKEKKKQNQTEEAEQGQFTYS